jgi:hypothetical protein
MDTANRSRLQQQPRRFVDRQQQQSSGSRDFQPRKSQTAATCRPPRRPDGRRQLRSHPRLPGQHQVYLKNADVESDAKAAKPDSPAQAAELKKAEEEGKSHSKAPGQ